MAKPRKQWEIVPEGLRGTEIRLVNLPPEFVAGDFVKLRDRIGRVVRRMPQYSVEIEWFGEEKNSRILLSSLMAANPVEVLALLAREDRDG
jgi:hypothetical protein